MTEAKDHYLAGLKLFGQQQHEEAIAEYDRALELQPDWVDALLARATCESNLGRHDRAVETVKRVIELTPDDAMAYTSLSIFLQRMDKIEEAEAAQAKARMISWKEELKTNPDAPPPDAPPPDDPGDMQVVQ